MHLARRHASDSPPYSASPKRAAAASKAFKTVVQVTAAVALVTLLAGTAAFIGLWVWPLAGLAGVALGTVVRDERPAVLSLIPATLLTNSALVPTAGRYVPSIAVLAWLILTAVRNRRAIHFRSTPTWLICLVGIYLIWMAIATVRSHEVSLSATYLVGSTFTLGVAILLIPSLDDRDGLVRELAATLVVSSVVIVLSGLLLFLVGSVQIFGKELGVYFFEEVTFLGHPTGIVLIQDYGPFVGPNTAPLAFALASALYLRVTSGRLGGLLWTSAGVIVMIGLLSTFSREGWLIGAITCLVVWATASRARIGGSALATGLALLVVFVAGITNLIGIVGRIDLSDSWYGKQSAFVLLNPYPTERGENAQASAPDAQEEAAAYAAVQAQCAELAAARAGGMAVNVRTSGNGPAATYPYRDTCSDPLGWRADWGTPPVGWRVGARNVELKGSSSLVARLKLWEASAMAIDRSPVFGFGPATDADAIIGYLDGDASLAGASTHGTYMRIAVEMGLPGLLIYLAITIGGLALAVRWLRVAPNSPQVVIAASVVALTAAEATDTLLLGGLSFAGFWLAIGIGLLAAGLPKTSVKLADRTADSAVGAKMSERAVVMPATAQRY